MPEAVLAGTPTHWRVFGHGPTDALALHCSLAHVSSLLKALPQRGQGEAVHLVLVMASLSLSLHILVILHRLRPGEVLEG